MSDFEMDEKDFAADSWSLAVDGSFLQQHKKEVMKQQDVIYGELSAPGLRLSSPGPPDLCPFCQPLETLSLLTQWSPQLCLTDITLSPEHPGRGDVALQGPVFFPFPLSSPSLLCLFHAQLCAGDYGKSRHVEDTILALK